MENSIWSDMWRHGMTGTFEHVFEAKRSAAKGRDAGVSVMEIYTSRCVARKLLRNDEPRYDSASEAQR